MKGIIRTFLVNSLSIFLTSLIMPGLKIDSGSGFIVSGIILSVFSAILDPFIKVITLPLHILTLGMLSFLTTLASLYLLTFIYSEIHVNDFVLGSISLLGFQTGSFSFSGFLPYVVISATIYLLARLINWLFS